MRPDEFLMKENNCETEGGIVSSHIIALTLFDKLSDMYVQLDILLKNYVV